MRFGIFCPPVSGHVNPFAALARELQNRGHSVTFFQMADMEPKIASEGVSFRRIGESDHPPGSLPESLAQLGRLHGRAALRFTVRAVQRTTEMICRDGPDAVRAAKLDMLLVDQMEPAAAAVAQRLGLPFVSVSNALALNRESDIPPPFTHWNYRPAWWARIRNRLAYKASDWMTRPVTRTLEAYRRQWNLPVYPKSRQIFLPLRANQPATSGFSIFHAGICLRISITSARFETLRRKPFHFLGSGWMDALSCTHR